MYKKKLGSGDWERGYTPPTNSAIVVSTVQKNMPSWLPSQVFFPMLSRLLEDIPTGDWLNLEETRVRASNLLCKVRGGVRERGGEREGRESGEREGRERGGEREGRERGGGGCGWLNLEDTRVRASNLLYK